MRIKEYEFYKAVYCSLCKEMGKTYGVFSRFTLSYDFTFYALLNMALKTDSCDIVKKACTCNPLKKCSSLHGVTSTCVVASRVWKNRALETFKQT